VKTKANFYEVNSHFQRIGYLSGYSQERRKRNQTHGEFFLSRNCKRPQIISIMTINLAREDLVVSTGANCGMALRSVSFCAREIFIAPRCLKINHMIIPCDSDGGAYY
jgi:hypothetical protein